MDLFRRRLLALCILALVPLAAASASAAPLAQQTVPPGTVIALQGTPHLWVADEQGALHWGGDTRALAGKAISWGDTRQVNIQQLRSFKIGDPWLSAGLLKIGDPIYLVKWESNQAQPTLLHIQSITDVELFGINATNYGALVMEQAAWEQRFGMSVATLQRGMLASAVPPAATPTPTPAPASGATATATPASSGRLEAKLAERTFQNLGGSPPTYRVTTFIEVTGAPPKTRLTVSAQVNEYRCFPECVSGYKSSWGPIDAGQTDETGKVRFKDEHSPYADYTYTFFSPDGKTTTVKVGNDYEIIND
jgi:hypothetical protein